MRRLGFVLIVLSTLLSIAWGYSVGYKGYQWTDFKAVYFGTRCLLEHHNPYNIHELESVYNNEGSRWGAETPQIHQAVILYVNMPTTFIFSAPFAMLPWGAAHILWLVFTALLLILAAAMIWDLASTYAPILSAFLLCILLANCQMIFSTGNTAGIVVGLCVVAVWCLLKQRFVFFGVLCLALSLAVKPHDAGLVWLFFLLAGAPYRKRALQAVFLTALIGLAAFIWLSTVAPHWMQDWTSNLTTISAPGGINEPGPNAIYGRSAAVVVDLQAAISIFRDEPNFYNRWSYLVCGVLLLLWTIRTLRAEPSPRSALLALAAISALTMLVTYHRPWDAKLLLLTIPACAMVWAEGGKVRWIALLVTTAGVFFTGDIPLTLLSLISNHLHLSLTSISGEILTLLLIRPASIVLLATAIFYLYMYWKRSPLMLND